MATQIKTLQVRVRDKHSALLRLMAYEVNTVWNLSNLLCEDAWKTNSSEVGPRKQEWLSAFSVQHMFAGIQKDRNWLIGSSTIQETIAVHAKSRQQFKLAALRKRFDTGSRRSLGWIPFKAGAAKYQNGCIKFAGHYFKIWDSYGLSGYKFRAGSFSEDARGRWYFNVAVEYECEPTKATAAVGIDLGLKDIATTSDGEKLPAKRWYREYEGKLKVAQRANNKKRAKAIHAKIKNRRKDAHHKFSTALVNKYAAIFVGDVSSKKLAKTNMAKSIYDAGWYQLKNQIQYKAIARGVIFEIVDEAYTTQTCSCCGAISCSSPKGRAGLGIREWICVECGELQDRDVNAARNILAAGHRRLGGGIPFL